MRGEEEIVVVRRVHGADTVVVMAVKNPLISSVLFMLDYGLHVPLGCMPNAKVVVPATKVSVSVTVMVVDGHETEHPNTHP